MKKIFLVIWIIGTICSCENIQEQTLTSYSWSIEQVVDLKTGKINQTKADQEKIWNFSQNYTYHYETKNKNLRNNINGEWNINDHKLLIFNEFDSTMVIIEKISDDEMVWLMKGKDSTRYYLESNDKKIYIPSFPDHLE